MLVLKTKFQKVSRVEFAPDGRGLAAAGKHGTYWWPSAFESPKPTRFGETECGGIGFSADGSYLIALHHGLGVCAIDLTDHTQRVARVGKFGSTLAVVESWTGGSMSGWRVGLGAIRIKPGNWMQSREALVRRSRSPQTVRGSSAPDGIRPTLLQTFSYDTIRRPDGRSTLRLAGSGSVAAP
jgi:hypothetical protein